MRWSDSLPQPSHFLPSWLQSLCVLSILFHLCGYSCLPIRVDTGLIPPLPTPTLLPAPGSPPRVRWLGLPLTWVSTWKKQREHDEREREGPSHVKVARTKLQALLFSVIWDRQNLDGEQSPREMMRAEVRIYKI